MDDFDLYRLFKTLHVISVVFVGVGGVLEGMVGPIVARATTTGEVRAYARLLYICENYLAIPAAIFIAVFGYLTADRAGYDIETPWLALSQGLFYLLVAIGLLVLRPAANELYRLSKDAPDGPVTPESRRNCRSRCRP